MVKRIVVALAILLIFGGFLTCKNPLHKFDNPVDSDSDNYIGVPSEDNDGDGIGQYDDVDEIVSISPENGTTVSELPLILTVYKFNPEKVKQYWIQVSTDNQDFDSGIVFDKDDYNSNECTISVDNFENNKVYYWRAKAYDVSKWSDNWSEIRSFNLDIDLTVPQNPSPSNGSTIIETTPLLGWEVMASATGYHMEVNTDSGFTGTVIADDDTLTASPSEYPITKALSDNTTYYWHVKIKNEDGVWGDWSNTWSFTIDIPTPTTPSPSNGSTIIETQPLLDWEDVTGADTYEIQINDENDFSGAVLESAVSLPSSQYTVTTVLSIGPPYYWRARIRNDDDVYGDWSAIWSFSVLENPVLSVSPTSLDFGTSSISETFGISNIGTGTLSWNVSESAYWITSVSPTSGTNSGTVTVQVSRSGLIPDAYNGTVSVTSNGGNQDVSLSLLVTVSLLTLDSVDYVGRYSSIAIDSAGKLHISYYNDVIDDLKYATNATGSWVYTTLDSYGDVGEYTSIAIDSADKVHISYFDNTNNDLKYATNATGSWVCTTLDSAEYVGMNNSIAIDSADKVHISYFDNTNNDLKYATNATGSWVWTTIDSTGSVGKHTSIAIDSADKVHISYRYGTTGDLKYATW